MEKLTFTEDQPATRILADIFSAAAAHNIGSIEIARAGEEVIVSYDDNGSPAVLATAPLGSYSALIERLKVLADLQVSVIDQPQEGSFELDMGGKKTSIAVSITPSQSGETARLQFS
jgi:type IV pilus assembly protein PilB